MKAYALLLGAAAVAVCVATPAAQAGQQHRVRPAAASAAAPPKLINLTQAGATIKDGDARCPDQPYYLYSGGKQDAFAAPADFAYPSPNLVASFPSGTATVPYDVPMNNAHFGDSFNLQNTRGVCYALIQFRVTPSSGSFTNDTLTFGHVDPPFSTVAQITSPASVTVPQSYALTSTGLSLLSSQTGYFLNKTPDQSILDVYLQDATRIDFVRIYVWYAPNCAQSAGC